MLKVSTKSQYGLRVMICLALSKNKICSLKEISQKERISFDYLEKIASKLEKAGLIKSKKGCKGGYFLAKISQKIRIGEIVKAVEGNAPLVRCTARSGSCPMIKKCFAKKFWQKLQKSLDASLNSLTLADLVK